MYSSAAPSQVQVPWPVQTETLFASGPRPLVAAKFNWGPVAFTR